VDNTLETTSDLRVRRIVRMLMGRDGISAGMLADAIGMGRSALAMRLAGHTRFTLVQVERIAAYFDVAPTLFFCDPDTLFPRGGEQRTPTSNGPSARWTMETAGHDPDVAAA
jgi:transcriptional regulator with XRE-family HTH domain